jgi:hypothetical protein
LERTNASLVAEIETLKSKSDACSVSETKVNALEADNARLMAEVAQLRQHPGHEDDEQTRMARQAEQERLVQDNADLQRELLRYKQTSKQQIQSSLHAELSPYDSDRAAELEQVNLRLMSENSILKDQQLRHVQQIEMLKLQIVNPVVKDQHVDPQWLPMNPQEPSEDRLLCWRLFYETRHLEQDLKLHMKKIAKVQGVARHLNDRLQLSESRNEELTLQLRKMKLENDFFKLQNNSK